MNDSDDIEAIVQTWRRAVMGLKESVTYQAILKEGEAIGIAKVKSQWVRKMLVLQDRDRFGEPSAKVVALLEDVTDLGRLDALVIRLLHVKTWEELLGVNGTPRQPRGRKKA